MISFSLIKKGMLVFYLGNVVASSFMPDCGRRNKDCRKPRQDFDVSSFELSDSNFNNCHETAFVEITEKISCQTRPRVSPVCCNPCEITNYFSNTCAYNFTLASYETIVALLFPKNINFCRPEARGLQFHKSQKHPDLENKIYLLLLHVLKTVPPTVFDIYSKYFYAGKYFECFLVLQRLFSPEAELERIIIDNIFSKNRLIRKKCPTCITFVDPSTKECSIVEFPTCNPKSRVCLYLPKQVLSFEEFLCTSFYLDEIILGELDVFTGCEFRHVFNYLLKLYYRNFYKLSYEARIIFFLRIKFFAFNAIGYSISHLCSGPKVHVHTMLIETAQCTNDVFYRSYAVGLGLLK